MRWAAKMWQAALMTPDWYPAGIEDDMRPGLFAAAAAGQTVALATITAATGGPRPVGSQMLVSADRASGYLSGGCIEPDVILHAREVITAGGLRRLVYGDGSPFLDLRLPCGGRIEVVIEQVRPADPRIATLQAAWTARKTCVWPIEGGGAVQFQPRFRLLVVGQDAFALAIASVGLGLGWDVILNVPFGPEVPPPIGCGYSRDSSARLFVAERPDAFTAIAVATHDIDADHDALVAALRSDAIFVGVLGARRRLPERIERLRADDVPELAIARLRAPIGLSIAAATPRETAIATIAEIVAVFRDGSVAR